MERSQYLAQAIAALGQAPPTARQGGLSQQQLMDIAKRSKAWKADNPGKSYLGSRFTQAVQNVAGAPGRMMEGLGMAPAPQPMQQPQPMPDQQQSVLQPSLMQNGNALPEYTIPEWARDGTAADDPGARTYFDLSKMNTPYGQPGTGAPASQPMGSPGAPGKRGAAAPSDPSAGGNGQLAQAIAKMFGRGS